MVARKAPSKTRPKTAAKTARSPKNGAEIPLGAHPGNTGGKPGRSGRPPDEFKQMCQAMASREATFAAVTRILADPTHPHFMSALKWASEHGYGKPAQPIAGDPDRPLEIRVRFEDAPK